MQTSPHALTSNDRGPRRVNRPRRIARRAGALCVALAMLSGLPSSAADGDRASLAETRRAIEATLAQLDDVAGRASQSEEALAEAQAAVATLEQALNELLAEVETLEVRVGAAQQEADAALVEAGRIEALVNSRARQAFMNGTPSAFSVLTDPGASRDLSGALDQLAMLNALAGRDAASIEMLGAARAQAAATAERHARALVELGEARAAQHELLAKAEAVFSQRASALSSLSSERERLLADQEQLESEADGMQAIIAREEAVARRRVEDAAAAARRAQEQSAGASDADATGESVAPAAPSQSAPAPATGCYQKPASGRVTSEYGPRWGRMHAGMDIDGDTGDPIVAAQSGTVIYVGTKGGYGRLTLVSHSDGVTTAYAHQSSTSVTKGQTVSRGEFIGRIGSSGNVTGSHLHFETRTSDGAKNPRNYLC
jgi:murein DD-endopeptidase MepM/ murein hydrolase activator NlpD